MISVVNRLDQWPWQFEHFSFQLLLWTVQPVSMVIQSLPLSLTVCHPILLPCFTCLSVCLSVCVCACACAGLALLTCCFTLEADNPENTNWFHWYIYIYVPLRKITDYIQFLYTDSNPQLQTHGLVMVLNSDPKSPTFLPKLTVEFESSFWLHRKCSLS